MNSVFLDNKIQSHDRKNTIYYTAPGLYLYNHLGYASSFEKVLSLIPAVAKPVTHPTKKRKSVSTHTEGDNDIFKHPRTSKNQKKRQDYVQNRPSLYQVDPLDFVNSLNSSDFLDLIKSLESIDVSDFYGCEDVDLHCYENADEIFEDIDMEKHLSEITVIPEGHKVNSVSSELLYPSFQHWGTNKSPFSHSISQLY
jgi:hypothetical protein